ncbi:MAG: hypothetical protein ABJN75_19970 [Hoeflea sp.]
MRFSVRGWRLAARKPETGIRGCCHGPSKFTVHFRRRERSEPLSFRNPQVPDAGTAGRIHAGQAVSRA